MSQQENPKVEQLFSIFKQAVEDERRAQAMYADAIAVCDDERVKKVLKDLYQDEIRHESLVIENYNKLITNYAPGN